QLHTIYLHDALPICSFAANHPGKKPGDRIMLDGIEQILWPVHCVQNTYGAEFAPAFDTSRIAHVFHKGVERSIDSYSTFFDNARSEEHTSELQSPDQ